MITSAQKLLMARAGVPSGPAFDPEAGLTLTSEIAPTSSDSTIAFNQKDEDTVFACDVTFGSTLSVGLLAEFGGTGAGAWVGITSTSPANFRVRAGDGGVTAPDADAAFLDISDFPQDDAIHTVVWEFAVAAGRVRLWIDGSFKGEAFTTGGGSLGSNRWAGNGRDAYINSSSTQVCVGETSTGWYSPTGASDLRHYRNQLVTA